MKWFHWIWAGLLFAAGTVLWMLFGRDSTLEAAEAEVEAVKASERAKKALAEKGHEEAVQEIEAEYEGAMRELRAKKAKEAEKLRKDPKKLARTLARISARQQV